MRMNFSDRFFIYSTVILWLLFIIVIISIVSQQGLVHTVTPSYLSGANLWMQGHDLYDNTGRGFIYLPQAAVLFIPFAYLAQLSFPLAEVTWRIVSLGLLVLALWQFVNLVEPKLIARMFFVVTVITIPLIFSSARNGQFNTILEVLMLFSVYAIANKKWCQAVFYLVLGLALKPTMIVLLLLLWALYRPLWGRLPIGLLAMFIFPFFTQTPAYVWAQYLNSISMLKSAATVGATTFDWAQFFGMLAQFKLIISQNIQDIIRVIAALGILYCSRKTQKNFNQNYAAIIIYVLASCYLLLFNPRTEHNDYGMLAPALGVFIGLYWTYGFMFFGWLLILIFFGLIVAGHLNFIDIETREFWSAPFFTLIFTIVVIIQICSEKLRRSLKLRSI